MFAFHNDFPLDQARSKEFATFERCPQALPHKVRSNGLIVDGPGAALWLSDKSSKCLSDGCVNGLGQQAPRRRKLEVAVVFLACAIKEFGVRRVTDQTEGAHREQLASVLELRQFVLEIRY